MRLRLLPQGTHVMVSPWRVAIAASVVRVVTTPVRAVRSVVLSQRGKSARGLPG
jgi:hypothetical protein